MQEYEVNHGKIQDELTKRDAKILEMRQQLNKLEVEMSHSSFNEDQAQKRLTTGALDSKVCHVNHLP
jgi:hypothetical protein